MPSPTGTPDGGFINIIRQIIQDYALIIVIVETIVIILLTLRLFGVF